MRILKLLIILLSTSTVVKAQQNTTKEQQNAQQTVINMFEALSMRDSVSLKTYCLTAITFYEYGEIWNLDTLISKAITQNTAIDFKRTNTFEFINTKTDKNTAWLTYRLSSIITKDGQEVTKEWLETVILSKQKKQWKVKHLHSTLIKKT
nr:nuclear transport factor 2 family protein [uncultured Flavobacterium sp.]